MLSKKFFLTLLPEKIPIFLPSTKFQVIILLSSPQESRVVLFLRSNYEIISVWPMRTLIILCIKKL